MSGVEPHGLVHGKNLKRTAILELWLTSLPDPGTHGSRMMQVDKPHDQVIS